jgi:hypothetical protein
MSVSKKLVELDGRFADCKFLVEANSFEKLCLWREFHAAVPWEQDCLGFSIQVGETDGRPVMVCFTFVKVNGTRVCFYDCPSEVVDYKMVDDFLRAGFNVKYDKTRWSRCDAMNFGNCLAVIAKDKKVRERMDKVMKMTSDFERHLESVCSADRKETPWPDMTFDEKMDCIKEVKSLWRKHAKKKATTF